MNAPRVARVLGIDIRVDASWIFIALLVSWSYWRLFDGRAAHAGVEALLMALAGALLFFGSVLGHELAHALEARRRGVHVSGITLFIFGGATQTRFAVRRPIDEFALTAIGPFTSFVLAASLGLCAYGADELGWQSVAAVTGLVGWINLGLGVFNLLPGAPLDGGRILRAGVWWITKDRGKAVRVAARAGQAVGGAVLSLGLAQVLFVTSSSFGGLWLALIGWFVVRAASAELLVAVLHQAVGGVDARHLVDQRPPVPAGGSVADAIERFRGEDVDQLAVEDGGATVGVVAVRDVQALDPRRRGETPIRDVMRSIAEVPSVPAGNGASSAVEQLDDQGVVAATESGEVIGLITAARVATVVRRTKQFGGEADTRTPS